MSINQGGIAFLILLVGDVVVFCHVPSKSTTPSDSEADIGFDDGEKVISCTTDLVGLVVGGSNS